MSTLLETAPAKQLETFESDLVLPSHMRRVDQYCQASAVLSNPDFNGVVKDGVFTHNYDTLPEEVCDFLENADFGTFSVNKYRDHSELLTSNYSVKLASFLLENGFPKEHLQYLTDMVMEINGIVQFVKSFAGSHVVNTFLSTDWTAGSDWHFDGEAIVGLITYNGPTTLYVDESELSSATTHSDPVLKEDARIQRAGLREIMISRGVRASFDGEEPKGFGLAQKGPCEKDPGFVKGPRLFFLAWTNKIADVHPKKRQLACLNDANF